MFWKKLIPPYGINNFDIELNKGAGGGLFLKNAPGFFLKKKKKKFLKKFLNLYYLNTGPFFFINTPGAPLFCQKVKMQYFNNIFAIDLTPIMPYH